MLFSIGECHGLFTQAMAQDRMHQAREDHYPLGASNAFATFLLA